MTIKWTEELVTRICDNIAGGLGIKEVAKLEGIPDDATIWRKMAKDEEFATRIARAREKQQEREVDECVRMADEATPENWQVVKLRIWARQWRASKLAPKKYGDRVALDHGAPIKFVVVNSPDERDGDSAGTHKSDSE